MFRGQRVLITGGSSGIGKQLAGDFLRLGAHVAIVGEQAERLERARAELASISPAVRSFVCDVGRMDSVERLGAAYLAELGTPDILVNNAGYAVYTAVEETPLDELDRLLRVNIVGAYLVTRVFLPSMIRAGRGHVVMMASIAGRVPLTPCGPYSAAKHGLVTAAETLRAEVADFGLQVHVVCPGRVDKTDFFRHESFVTRTPRHETRWTVSVEAVSAATVAAIRKGRFFTYVPGFLRPFVWLTRVFPVFSGPLLQALMRSRVRSVYAAKRNAEASPKDERAY